MWTAFAALAGGAASGLTGLTFIVVSFRYDAIARSVERRSRAAQTLTMFLTVLVVATALVMPQVTPALGVEVVLVAIGSGVLLTVLDRRARREQTNRPSTALIVVTALFLVLLVAGGLLLVVGLPASRYPIAAGELLGLVWGAVGAWSYLTAGASVPAAST